VKEHATPIDGMWVVVGRGDNTFYSPDRVYVLIQMAPESHDTPCGILFG
jgi:hypothetical protein